MNKLDTKDLVDRLKNNEKKVFEVSLNNGLLRATHLISFGGKLLYDTGIDSEEIKWKPNEFIEYYYESYWEIEQIV